MENRNWRRCFGQRSPQQNGYKPSFVLVDWLNPLNTQCGIHSANDQDLYKFHNHSLCTDVLPWVMFYLVLYLLKSSFIEHADLGQKLPTHLQNSHKKKQRMNSFILRHTLKAVMFSLEEKITYSKLYSNRLWLTHYNHHKSNHTKNI